MRGSFSKQRTSSSDQNATATNQMHLRILNWNIAIVAVLTDFTNMAVMLSDLLRNLTFNRSAHCTQVSDQCPLGLLFSSCDRKHTNYFSGPKLRLLKWRKVTFSPIRTQKIFVLYVNDNIRPQILKSVKNRKRFLIIWYFCIILQVGKRGKHRNKRKFSIPMFLDKLALLYTDSHQYDL